MRCIEYMHVMLYAHYLSEEEIIVTTLWNNIYEFLNHGKSRRQEGELQIWWDYRILEIRQKSENLQIKSSTETRENIRWCVLNKIALETTQVKNDTDIGVGEKEFSFTL